MANVWQNILASDALCNHLRTPNNPCLKTLYLRRRALLLQEKSTKVSSSEESFRRSYLQLRSTILYERYGVPKEILCSRSRSVSLRGMNVSLSENKNHNSQDDRYMTIQQMLDHHKEAISNLTFAKDEASLLACASFDGTLSICEVSPICRVLHILSGHAAAVTEVHWSDRNEWLLSCSLDASLRLWDAQTGKCLRIFRDPTKSSINCCAFLPSNNNLVVAGNKRGMVQILNISTGIFPLNGSSQIGAPVTCLTCDGLGRLIWAGDDRGYINSFLVDSATGRLTKGRRLEIQPSVRSQGPLVTSISFTAWAGRGGRDPSLLVSCAANALFLYKIVDEQGGLRLKRRCPLAHHQSKIRSEFCPVSSQPGAWCPNLVSGGEDGCIYFLHVDATSTTTRRIPAHASAVLSVAANYNGALLASGDSRGIIMLWGKPSH
ncbi:WD repeat-containing protein 13-like [Daphnia pulicaria]|uniref:WD repeat-containing protein 13-like n=1 Tax=Daphnia pulicaria TaxID=35523 RepID=UPI001EEB321A|nr:WD repeat-containing protein 13-like [Daphnia pulicaria]XP_046652476.1 WD repeat-containing protein 13-like [Daphnia pulicaria]XP_046652477.1 WD repeat-containing protein 13-like [Daphnia pulicaria]